MKKALSALGSRISYANVMATVAVFLALAGGGFAIASSNTKVVKKIVRSLAPTLSVGHANSADSATSASQLGGISAGGYQSRVRWASINSDGTIQDQSGGITVDHDSPGICTPGCDYIDFGTNLLDKAIVATPKLVQPPGGVPTTDTRGVFVWVCAQPAYTCTIHNDTNHAEVITQNAAGAQADRAYYIAVIGK